MSAPLEGRRSLPLAFAFAGRELRGGLSGFLIFIACIALGVGAITGVAGVARALTDGLASQGRTILGGDVSFALIQREASGEERAWLAQQGEVGTVALTRAMARAPNGDAALAELKGVDASWPQHGAVEVKRAPAWVGRPFDAMFALQDGRWGAAMDPVLAGRLGLKLGDSLTLGGLPVEYRAELLSEPDKLASGLALGPRVIVSQAALGASGLLQPGSLVRWVYRVTLPDAEARDPGRLAAAAPARWPEAGFEIRTRDNVSPQFSRNIERFTQFLTLVGLTALLVGGVGVANATRAFVERQRPSIAALKALGASGRFVFLTTLIQVMALAAVGVALGLVLGAALPFVAARSATAWLPFAVEPSLYPRELALGVLYGLLTALAFSVWPVGKAHDIPVSALFRDVFDQERARPRLPYVLLVGMAGLALAASAVGFAWDRQIALLYVGIAAVSFVGLRLVGAGVMRFAASLPRARSTELRLAVANIHKPGALTPSIVLSLGLGLTLLVTLGVIDGSIRGQLAGSLPAQAPSFFFVDIPGAESDAFDAFLQKEAPGATINRVPMMRGRIVSLKGIAAADFKAPEKASWVLDGDRGITYAERLPLGSSVTAGAWWPAEYAGEPLVSFGDELARDLGLAVGDPITVNVLGRNVTARIANLRRIDWQSLGINFVMVFSPNAFAGAPHSDLATLSLPGTGDTTREIALTRAVAAAWPAVSVVRVKDTLAAIADVVGQLSTAIRSASAIALLTSVLVLAGALAAGQRARLYDAVVLKTLGATRRQLLTAFLLEYAMLGFASACFGAVAGVAAAYAIMSAAMRLPFAVAPGAILGAVTFALVVAVGVGLTQSWRILGQKPARYLRAL